MQIHTEQFSFEGKDYEVRALLGGTEMIAQAFQNGQPVSPRCTCDWETVWDFQTQQGREVVKILVGWAREFVEDKTLEKWHRVTAEMQKDSNVI